MRMTCQVLLQALEHDKANDIMFWASSYNLFVTWAANAQHPWDNLPKSEAACAILEIGKLRNSDGEVSTGRPVHQLSSAPWGSRVQD